jgi:hypothetical protein
MAIIIDHNTVNKLILVGNGFDLALGLKTNYTDFLFRYLKKTLEESFKSDVYQYNQENHSNKYHFYEDELISISSNVNYEKSQLLTILDSLNSLKNVFDFIKIRGQFFLEPKSNLFRIIYERSINNWVDIESIYYELLKECIGRNNNEILKLNSDFNFLKIKLEEYLISIVFDETHFETEKNNFMHQFFDAINNDEIFDAHKDDLISMGSTYFINFNYTDALSTLVNNFQFKNRMEYEINHIHGKLKSESHPIIFGFGDEMDLDYKKIEELKDNKYFENIKSFKYMKNSNYRALMRFLASGNYQVCVYGHSCGLSDRVMLNEIFEHENCKSIKIYFYENDKGEIDFTDKTMDISRHFNSNKLMRKKIVEFNPNNKIPQIKN